MRPVALSLVVVIGALFGCGTGDQTPEAVDQDPGTLSVYVVNYPLGYFAGRIGGDGVEVHFPAPAEGDPAFWSPDADTIAAYQNADLILLNGADYAKWVERATLPSSKIVDTSSSFAFQHIPLDDTVTHSHGPEGEHAHGGWAFTTWIDPTQAVEQSRAVHEAMVAARPDQAGAFDAGFADLVADLSALDQRLAAAADAIGDQPLIFSHPVYQYLIRHYGLNGISVHWEPDQAPDLLELEHLLEEREARWMIWEGAPLAQTVTDIEAYGVKSLVFDPCGNTPDTGDYMTVMAANAEALETIAAERPAD